MPGAACPGHLASASTLRKYTPWGILMLRRSAPSIHRKDTTMCSPARCAACGKITWSGCGQHIEQALDGVAQADRCTC